MEKQMKIGEGDPFQRFPHFSHGWAILLGSHLLFAPCNLCKCCCELFNICECIYTHTHTHTHSQNMSENGAVDGEKPTASNFFLIVPFCITNTLTHTHKHHIIWSRWKTYDELVKHTNRKTILNIFATNRSHRLLNIKRNLICIFLQNVFDINRSKHTN